MSYTKTTWQNDQAPAINATNLNKIETGIFNNDAKIYEVVNTLGVGTATWDSSETYAEGDVVIYANKLYKNITGNYTITAKGARISTGLSMCSDTFCPHSSCWMVLPSPQSSKSANLPALRARFTQYF